MPKPAAPATDLVAAVHGALLALAPETRHGPLVVATSGGADSSGLAALLAEALGPEALHRVLMAHVDHGWHGPEGARREREAVDALAVRLGLRVRHVAPPWHGPGLRRTEAAARRWRYEALEGVAREVGARFVLTGHHRRDQAETVCMRARRGSGAVGLGAIAPRRLLGAHGVEVLRPLLDVAPRDLRAFLDQRGITWIEDPANTDARHDRARLRRERGEAGPADLRLAAFAERMRWRVEAREREALIRLGTALHPHPLWGAVEVERAALAGLPPRLAEAAWRHAGHLVGAHREGPWLTREHVARLADAVRGGGGLSLPRGVRVQARGARVWLWRAQARGQRLCLAAVRAGAGECIRLPGAAAAARLAAPRVGPRPVLRRVAAGDRFWPAGREPNREVDVLGWMKRRGIPAALRRRQCVVAAGEDVAWVVGLRVDRRFLVPDDANEAWHVAVATGSGFPAEARDGHPR